MLINAILTINKEKKIVPCKECYIKTPSVEEYRTKHKVFNDVDNFQYYNEPIFEISFETQDTLQNKSNGVLILGFTTKNLGTAFNVHYTCLQPLKSLCERYNQKIDDIAPKVINLQKTEKSKKREWIPRVIPVAIFPLYVYEITLHPYGRYTVYSNLLFLVEVLNKKYHANRDIMNQLRVMDYNIKYVLTSYQRTTYTLFKEIDDDDEIVGKKRKAKTELNTISKKHKVSMEYIV